MRRHLVTPSALALLALLLAACQHGDVNGAPVVPVVASEPGPPPLPPTASQPKVLVAGQSVLLGPGATLRFERVAGDSRCPAGKQCIWAGEVTLALSLVDAQGRADFELRSTTAPKATVKGYALELAAYGACPDGAGECATLAIASLH